MTHMKYFLLILSFLLSCSLEVYAAPADNLRLKVVVLDKESAEPLSYVTVTLTREGEQLPFLSTQSDNNGAAVFAKLSRGSYILGTVMMGYKDCQVKLKLEKSSDLGEIRLETDARALDAASISAVGNPIVVKKDTVEYTASSFKTTDNDMLEQLLKKLPGLEVESDGSITANGETVKKITIDGKTFFLDDPKLASKNIPAKLVEKVQVVEKKSDQAMFTGVDDGERETVIDLKFKKGMKNGWIGNVLASCGHDIPGKGESDAASGENGWRYGGNAMVGKFSDKSQVSVILNGNNTNNEGFHDIAGSMMKGMRGMLKGIGHGRYGMGGDNGITTSWMGGVNGVFMLLDGRMELGGNYLYNGSDKLVEERSDKITYLDDGRTLHNHNDGESRTLSQGHRFGFELEHKFSERTSIDFEPQFNFGTGRMNEHSEFSTLENYKDKERNLNKGFSTVSGINRNWNISGKLMLRHRFVKPGRTLSMYFRYNFSNNNMDGYNQSFMETTTEEELLDTSYVNQRYDSRERKSSLRGTLSYTEPLGRNFFFEANYTFGWSRNTSMKDTYNSAGNELVGQKELIYVHDGERRDETYSNDILQNYRNHVAGINFSYRKEKLYVQVGGNANPSSIYNITNGRTYRSNTLEWSPRVSFKYDINDNNDLKLYYYGYSSEPSVSQLIPVPDNSDPLNMDFGNPYLKPYFEHNIRGKYAYANKKSFTSVYLRLGASIVQDAIVSASWYDGDGIRYSLPVNGGNKSNVYGGLMVNSRLGQSDFFVSSWSSISYSNSNSYLGNSLMADKTPDYFLDKDGNPTDEFNYEAFHKDNPDIRKSQYFSTNKTDVINFYERLRFSYRIDLVELNLGGKTRMNKSWFTMKSDQKPRWNNQVDFSMNWTLPEGFGLVADFDYNWYNGYSTPQEDEFVLNAEFSKLLCKNKMTLAIKAFDIFNQSKNLSVSDNANFHQETWNNSLGRYVAFSLVYRFGSNKQGGGPHSGPYPGGPRPRH